MAGNKSLGAARKAKNDEFYTRRVDIEDELRHYAGHFRGKVVYCNCDDPVTSEFWQFFVRNFQPWGLKKLIATHYEPDDRNYSYKLEMEPDENGQFSIFTEPVRTPLPCNGDFRSAACIELLEEADIIVTNPPFSLFREYVAQLVKYGKKFLIIGNKNAVKYKEIFPLFQENKVWLGVRNINSDFWLYVPEGQPYEKLVDGRPAKHIMGCWFTNLDHNRRYEPYDLRGNYYCRNPENYPHYINYDGIEVSKVSDIPCDYDGNIGVPITFLSVYCPDQFEILGLSRDLGSPMSDFADDGTYSKGGMCFYIPETDLLSGLKYRRLYDRIVIRRKGAVASGH